MPKILILGEGRNGKDTAAAFLCEKANLTFKSSSEVCLDVIWPVLAHVGKYPDKETAFNDRIAKRQLWKFLISTVNGVDKTALTRKILAASDVYVGMRSREEYQATKHMFDHTIWVDASLRIEEKDPSMDISYCQSEMHLIDNNRDLAALEANIDHFVRTKLNMDPYEKSIKDLIVDWADEVFPDRTITNAIQKMALEELPEYLMNQSSAEELADIGILLYDIANLAGIDLELAIRQKMAVNMKRTWAIDSKTGLMKHIEEGGE